MYNQYKNLLQETLACLHKHGKTEKDIVWLGSRDIEITWENFVEVADVEYDSDYGIAEVVEDIIIVGRGWHIRRRNYGGLEWWEMLVTPQRPTNKKKVYAVVNGQCGRTSYNSTLLAMNTPKNNLPF